MRVKSAIDQQLLRDDPNSEQYNADYGPVQKAGLPTSNDLGQLHAADTMYHSFTPTP